MSLRLPLINLYLRLFERPGLARTVGAQAGRDRLERSARLFFGNTPGTLNEPFRFSDTVTGQVVRPKQTSPDTAILYVHGGGFTFGSSETHRRLGAAIAAKTNLEVFLPDYRLAPEHPYPAGLDDCFEAFEALVARGYRRVILIGDSAGGGLVFSTLVRALSDGLDLPAAVIGLSPWVDLTLAGESMVSNDRSEVTLPTERMQYVAATYRGTTAADDPEISPVFADFTGAPPCLIHVSDSEILRDDAYRLEEALRRDGAQVTLRTWVKTPHVWHIHHGMLPEARDAIDDIAVFVGSVLSDP